MKKIKNHVLGLKIFATVFVFSLFSTMYGFDKDNGSVAHKDDNLTDYLKAISGAQGEKVQILEHILDKKGGTFVDLGTGGDTVAHMLKKIPNNLPVKLIASDIDQAVLNSLSESHPEIVPYLQQKNESRPRLSLIRMDATNMYPIAADSIDGVSASALVHEVYSYVPPKSSLDQFFIELVRVLKKDGVFIYRDPKWDDNPDQDCLVILKDSLAKAFVTLFLPRYLDKVFSCHRDYAGNCTKPTLYDHSHVQINFFNKYSNQTQKTTLLNFINTPVADINFFRNISIEAPRGLISELQRHYVLFMKDVFTTDLIDQGFFDRETIHLDEVPVEKQDVLREFLQANNIHGDFIETSSPMCSSILCEKKHLYSFIENGIWCKILNEEKITQYLSTFHTKGVNPKLFLIQDHRLWLDAKLAILLFQGVHTDFFQYLEINPSLPLRVFDWLKREGEESYFYKTTDDLIVYLGRLSKYYLKNTEKDGYILCPVSISKMKTVSRDLYKTIATTHMDVMDIDGNKQDVSFDKNIIHFKLMKKEDAFKVYNEILSTKGKIYWRLQEWLKDDFSR